MSIERRWWILSLATLLVASVLLASPAPSRAASPQDAGKKVLTLADYPRWSRISGAAISDDGAWMTYTYDPNEGDATLYVRHLDGDERFEAKNGSGAQFSSDSAWVAFITSPPDAGGGRGGRAGGGGGRGGRGQGSQNGGRAQAPTRTLHLIELGSGNEEEIEGARAFAFSEDARYIAVSKERADREAEHQGADFILRDLRSGVALNIGNVAQYAFNDDVSQLAYVVDAAEMSGNGLYVLELASGRIRPLDTSASRYEQLSWNEDGSALAALRGDEVEGFEQRANTLIAFRDAAAGGGRVIYDPAGDAAFPDGFVLSELASIDWNDDGSRLFVGIKAQREEAEERDGPQADVDVWHWKDEEVQSVQMVRANAERNFTYAAALILDPPHLVRLADDDMRSVSPTEDGLTAIGRDDSAYRMDWSIAGGLADYYAVDTSSGARTPIAEHIRYSLGTSPDSRWFLYQEEGHVKARDLRSGETTDLSAVAGVDFVNEDFDTPTEKSTYGLAGWSADGNAVLLNHQYDIWVVPLRAGDDANATANDGPATASGSEAAPDGAYMLTQGIGARDEIRFRYVDLERGGGGGGRGGRGGGRFGGGRGATKIDLDEPIMLSAYGEWTKKSGYWWAYDGAVDELIFDDKMIGGIQKAKDTDRFIFSEQTIVEFPDYWLTDGETGETRRITDANPQQAEYAWTPGRRLIEYTDRRGHRLQATLTLPAGYEEGRRYPMLVYFYEKMSQNHHQYSMPVYDDRPHMSTYASDGYLVLMPDIIYDDGKPGSSALDDVTSAVQEAIDLGYADSDHVGLQGHSWGGYESSYIVTQTDMFAAVVTGAPLTDLVSMHNILYKSSGGPNAPLIQFGQGRMASSPWDNLAGYIEQSPVNNAEGITTPFLILQGTADGAVDWNQGLEFYIAARRLGKEVIFLSYPDEPHHLAKEENQKDFQMRMKQFFDHYLKGTPAPVWMTDGVPFLDKGRDPVWR